MCDYLSIKAPWQRYVSPVCSKTNLASMWPSSLTSPFSVRRQTPTSLILSPVKALFCKISRDLKAVQGSASVYYENVCMCTRGVSCLRDYTVCVCFLGLYEIRMKIKCPWWVMCLLYSDTSLCLLPFGITHWDSLYYVRTVWCDAINWSDSVWVTSSEMTSCTEHWSSGRNHVQTASTCFGLIFCLPNNIETHLLTP